MNTQITGFEKIKKLIINSPYEEPKKHWHYNRTQRKFILNPGRRPAGYTTADPNATGFDDPGLFCQIPLVNDIRLRVEDWRQKGNPGASIITQRLLEHWRKQDVREFPFFFCQLEAMETLIWLVEGPPSAKEGISIQNDGGPFQRWCSKMATGSGKTVVMAMLIAWQILNKIQSPKDDRFVKNVLIIAPGLTVKNRLAVLYPEDANNYYEKFAVVPQEMMEKLRQGKVIVHNWHKLAWESEEQIAKKKSVVKLGAKSDRAYAREILEDMAKADNMLVINDEAHHAWRRNAIMDNQRHHGANEVGVDREDEREATIWMEGLDRLHKVCPIKYCFDLSATPYVPFGGRVAEDALFQWIVSDFGLNDAIESGLVKTPRVVIHDDSRRRDENYRSRIYHLYNDPDVKDDLGRTAHKAKEDEPLPQLVMEAYQLLGTDWKKTWKEWRKNKGKDARIPVMISVANNTTTAARIKNVFYKNKILIKELCQEDGLLHIDSKVLKQAEQGEENPDLIRQSESNKKRTAKQRAEELRRQVSTIGKPGEAGQSIRNIIAVGMLSEGWDAQTVTHIMGLRAFSSQLLCEQVVGRGLRRTSYEIGEDGLFAPEYVNVFGVPFTFLPHEEGEKNSDTPKPKTAIYADDEKIEHEITWPNILYFNEEYKDVLSLDVSKIPTLELDPTNSVTHVELAPIISDKPANNPAELTEIDLREIAETYRLQTYVFRVAAEVYRKVCRKEKESEKIDMLIQLIKQVEKFIESDKIHVPGDLFSDPLKKRVLILLSLDKVVEHVWAYVKKKNIRAYKPVYDQSKRIMSTADMPLWYTSAPCGKGDKTHISHVVYDSGWEKTEALLMDKHKLVASYVKNDRHLGFRIYYKFKGSIRSYFPDFLIQLKDGTRLVLEVKGIINEEAKAKQKALQHWINGVNATGEFGTWGEEMTKANWTVKEALSKYE